MYCVLLCVIVEDKDIKTLYPSPLDGNHYSPIIGRRSWWICRDRDLTCAEVSQIQGRWGTTHVNLFWPGNWAKDETHMTLSCTSGTCDTCHLEGCGTKPDTQPDRTCHHTNQHPAFCPWDMRAMPSCCFSECQHHIHQRLQTSLRLFLMDKHWITELVLSEVLLLWIIPHHDKKYCNTGKAFGMVWPGFHSCGVQPMNA